MREAAAAGLFPREVFVEDANGMTGAGQLFATHCAGRSAADDYDFSHEVSLGNADLYPGAKSSGDGENREGKTRKKYSTENCGGGRRACLSPYYIDRQPLQN